MNIQALQKTLDLIENSSKLHFSMAEWGNESHCQTAACIAGFAVAANDGVNIVEFEGQIYMRAGEILELNEYEKEHLFFGRWSNSYSLRDISKTEAINYLREVIANPMRVTK